MSLIFVDVEAGFDSPCPGIGDTGMTEFGAVEYATRATFHGFPAAVVLPDQVVEVLPALKWRQTFIDFKLWLEPFEGRPIFVSDNPAYDWQWINYYFHLLQGKNPFGHSARRIGDFYAGIVGDFRSTNNWKKLRITKHDHNPVNDAMGNVEAFEQLVDGLHKF